MRWPAKNSGAFVFGCTFLWSFLLCKQKKGQAVCIKTKKRKERNQKVFFIGLNEKKNIYPASCGTTDNRGLPSSFIHVAIAAGQDPGRTESPWTSFLLQIFWKTVDYLTTYLNCNLTDLIIDMSICFALKYVEA